MFAALTWGLFVHNPPDDGLNDDAWLKPFFICTVFVFMWFTPDTYCRRVTWDDEGLIIKRFLRPEKHVIWSDVSGLEYKPFAQYWRLGFKDGTGFMFYDMMKGSKEFIQAYEFHIK